MRVDRIKWTVLEEYWFSAFNYGKLPKLFVEYVSPTGLMIINDPELVNELYITKNKIWEKADKMKRIFLPLTGQSLLFEKSDELWARKRK